MRNVILNQDFTVLVAFKLQALLESLLIFANVEEVGVLGACTLLRFENEWHLHASLASHLQRFRNTVVNVQSIILVDEVLWKGELMCNLLRKSAQKAFHVVSEAEPVVNVKNCLNVIKQLDVRRVKKVVKPLLISVELRTIGVVVIEVDHYFLQRDLDPILHAELLKNIQVVVKVEWHYYVSRSVSQQSSHACLFQELGVKFVEQETVSEALLAWQKLLVDCFLPVVSLGVFQRFLDVVGVSFFSVAKEA